LPDRVSIGVLARTFTNDLVDEVIDTADVREVRYRRLPARLVVLFVLACWLFMRSGYGLVLAKLVDALAVGGPGWGGWQSPTTASITKAKARLGPEPLRLLFDRVKGPQGTAITPGVFWRELRVVTMDGFTCDVSDTVENSAFFGRGANGSGTPNPYPQLRSVALAEGGTRALIHAAYGPFRTGEQTLAVDVVTALRPGMLCLADRNFPSYTLWRQASADGAALLWRMSASFTLPVLEAAEQMSELFCLATTLLDPTTAPATELADLYPQRWQAGTVIGDISVPRSWSTTCVWPPWRHSTVPGGQLCGQARPESMIRSRNWRVRGCSGDSSTAAGVPCSRMVPPSRKQTRSATCRAKPISCVAISMVIPSPLRSRTSRSTSPTSSGSSAEVISSSSNSRGELTSARTMATRCC
jgi:hypothetical protein